MFQYISPILRHHFANIETHIETSPILQGVVLPRKVREDAFVPTSSKAGKLVAEMAQPLAVSPKRGEKHRNHGEMEKSWRNDVK